MAPPKSRISARELVGVVFVLCGHLGLSLGSARYHSPTFDEPIHLTAGIAYWMFNDYRLQPENGNLPQRWSAACAMLFDKINFPSRDQAAWRESDVWDLAQQLFYRENNDSDRLLFHGRMGIALASATLCLVIYLWSRTAWGPGGAWVSLIAAAFCPNLLAHGHLTTSDLFATLFFTGSVWHIGKNLECVTLARTLCGGAWVAGLFLSKFSAPLIVPMAVLICVARLARRTPLECDIPWCRRRTVMGLGAQIGVMSALTAVYATMTWIAIWAAFGCRYSAASPPVHDVQFYELISVEKACEPLGTTGRIIEWTAQNRLLPEAYLYGAAFVKAHGRQAAFWNGHYTIFGWRGFFPYCWLVKTPLPTLALVALAVVAWLAWLRRHPAAKSLRMLLSSRLVPAFALLLIYWPTAILSTRNLGHRHILPTCPALFVLLGGIAFFFPGGRRPLVVPPSGGLDRQPVSDGRWMRRLVALLLAWLVVESVLAFPNYIAYFNSAIGTRQGYRHLVDSSLDWGQDLPQLKTWLETRQPRDAVPERIFLAYFGQADPMHYGIQGTDIIAAAPLPLRYDPGLYCVSATMLAALYNLPVPWSAVNEEGYRATRLTLREYDSRPAEELQAAFDRRDPRLLRAIRNFNIWQAARLMACLRHREPTANIGGSILIFDLNRSDLDAALNGRVPE